MELEHRRLSILKVQPWALWGNVETTVGIGCPAVEAAIPVVVGVHVVLHLVAVVASAVEMSVSLERLGDMAGLPVVYRAVEERPTRNKTDNEKRNCNVLLCNETVCDKSLEVLQEGSRVPRLVPVVVVVHWESVILDHSCYHLLHITVT